MTQAKLELEGFDAYDLEPPALPDVFASRPLITFGKYRGPARGTIRLTGVDANGKMERELAVADHPPSDDLVALQYLWARDRVERLSDELAIAPGPELETEITELGMKHHLMTAFTGFVAVDDAVRTKDGRPAKVLQPLPLPKGVESSAVHALGASGLGHVMGSISLSGLGTVGSGGGGSLVGAAAQATRR